MRIGKVDKATAFLAALFAGLFIFRIWLIPNLPFNPDEYYYAGNCYRVFEGQKQFLEFYDIHMPLSTMFFSPAFYFIDQSASLIYPLRWINLIFLSAMLAALFLFVKKISNVKTALLTLCILNSFDLFIERTIHFRSYPTAFLFLIIGLIVLLKVRSENPAPKKILLPSLFFALAVMMQFSMAFLFAGALLWLLIVNLRNHEGLRALTFPVICGLGAIGVFLLVYFFMFGLKAVEALAIQRDLAEISKFYTSFRFSTLNSYINSIKGNQAPFLILAAGFLYIHIKWIIGRLRDEHVLLIALLADFGMAYIFVFQDVHPQYFFPLLVFGSAVGAHLFANVVFRSHEKLNAAFLIAVVLLLAASNAFSWRHNLREIDEYADYDYQNRLWNQMPWGTDSWNVPYKTAVSWLGRYLSPLDPFDYRSNKTRVRQLRLILENSKPGDAAMSDMVNPPFRKLPAPILHGLAIIRFLSSDELAENKEFVEIFQRYSPSYDPTIKDAGERFVNLFEHSPPQVMLLDGGMGGVFVSEPKLRDWMAPRYRLIFDSETYALYAIRKK